MQSIEEFAMRKSVWTRSAAVAGAAAFAMAATVSPASAQAPAPNPLEGSIHMSAIDSVVDTSVALSAMPWALSAYAGSFAYCVLSDCADDNM